MTDELPEKECDHFHTTYVQGPPFLLYEVCSTCKKKISTIDLK